MKADLPIRICFGNSELHFRGPAQRPLGAVVAQSVPPAVDCRPD